MTDRPSTPGAGTAACAAPALPITPKMPSRYIRLLLEVKPPLRRRATAPTRCELEAARVYHPRLIPSREAAKLLGLEGRVRHPAATVRMRMYRLRQRLGIRPYPAARPACCCQLSAVGEI